MHIFISAGEPSGDVHGASLIRELRARRPDVEIVGFGGDRMQAEGAKLLFPLVQLAVMWFARVIANITTFLSLLSRADRYFRHHRPDAVVLIDYPGFNWWIARRAKFHGIPVYYFVPPQLWAWAGWRVEKMRRFVDHVLCTLPFEKTWYAERGVEAEHVGHPFFDELLHQKLDAAFVEEQRRTGDEIVALLPGSRDQEIERNLSTLIGAAEHVHAARPGTRFLVACYKPRQQSVIDAALRKHPGLSIETHVGRTPEILEVSKACVAVSGSVSLEILYRRKPAAIVYRIGKYPLWLGRKFMTTRFICLVNLLAGRELYPEFLTDRNEGKAIAEHLLSWLGDDIAYGRLVSELTALRETVARPGACARAAEAITRHEAGISRRAA